MRRHINQQSSCGGVVRERERTVPSAALKSSEDLSPHISAISARSFQQENEEGPRWGPHGQGVGVPKDQWRRAADPTGAAHPSVSRDQGSRCPRTAWYLCLGSSWHHGRSPSDRRSSKTTEWVGQWRHQNIQPQSPEPTKTCIPAGSDGDGELLPPCPCPTDAKAYLLCIIVNNVPSPF